MKINPDLLINGFFMGLGLSADAFSLSLVNGLRESSMTYRKMFKIAGVFAAFQGFMPILGWYFLRGLLLAFSEVRVFIPGISFVLLLFVGGKMIIGGIIGNKRQSELGAAALFTQGLITSVDALSAGFSFGGCTLSEAVISALIIAAVTFALCLLGLKIGKKAGEKLSDRAELAGGLILILLGFKILFA